MKNFNVDYLGSDKQKEKEKEFEKKLNLIQVNEIWNENELRKNELRKAMEIWRTIPDGNCLFRAISKGITQKESDHTSFR